MGNSQKSSTSNRSAQSTQSVPVAETACQNCGQRCGKSTVKPAKNPTKTGDKEILEIPETMKYRVGVVYGYMSIKEFFATDLADLRVGEEVITRSPRGGDYGKIFAGSIALESSSRPPLAGFVQRRLTESDRNMLTHIIDRRLSEEKKFCVERVKERELPMKIVAAEHLISGDKIIFYFVADGRIDFRELVKDLARRFRARIEMKQIGVRDEARMLSDHERCGRELCCRSFLRDLEPVTMRMAKEQKATLDPNKISGQCGRLMCCLRFEDSLYQDRKVTESTANTTEVKL